MARVFEGTGELPRVEGTRLDLRQITREDAPELLKIFGDPEVMRYWSSPPLEDEAAAVGLVEQIHGHFEARDLFQWGVALKDSDAVIGTCTLWNLDEANRRAEIGFALARDEWGRGLASEAVATLIGFAFGALELHRLEADVDPENARSLILLERQGFKREGLLRERWHSLGEVQDTVFLGLLRREWTGA